MTYDEHGGLFDHVTPPPAVSPFPSGAVTNFDYNVFGVRVPALFINPYVQPGLFQPPGTTPFDHTSLLATLAEQLSLSGSLSPRVDSAPTFAGLINPKQQPITPPAITPPVCVWSPPVIHSHSDPMLRSALWRGHRRLRSSEALPHGRATDTPSGH